MSDFNQRNRYQTIFPEPGRPGGGPGHSDTSMHPGDDLSQTIGSPTSSDGGTSPGYSLPELDMNAVRDSLFRLGMVTEREWFKAVESLPGQVSLEMVLDALQRMPGARPPLSSNEPTPTVLTKFQITQIRHGHVERLLFKDRIILDRLGAGGMGEVFLAYYPNIQKYMAIKTILKDKIRPSYGTGTESVVEARFFQEAKLLAKLNHPCLPGIHEYGEAHGAKFFVMDYVRGETIEDRVERLAAQGKKMSIREALNVVTKVTEALQHAHKENVIHRDIKPSNIMIDANDGVKVLDMGIAKFVNQDSNSNAMGVTAGAVSLGTPNFMPPEQWADAKNVGPTADIYSLGCTLYYMLTGEDVFPGLRRSELLFAHTSPKRPLLKAKRPDAPKQLATILGKMYRPEVKDRFQSAKELLEELQRLEKSLDRSVWPWVGAGVAAAAIIAGGVYFALQPVPKQETKTPREYLVEIQKQIKSGDRDTALRNLATLTLLPELTKDGETKRQAQALLVKEFPEHNSAKDYVFDLAKGDETFRKGEAPQAIYKIDEHLKSTSEKLKFFQDAREQGIQPLAEHEGSIAKKYLSSGIEAPVLQEKIENLSKAIDHARDDQTRKEAYLKRGEAFQRKDEFDKALADFKSAQDPARQYDVMVQVAERDKSVAKLDEAIAFANENKLDPDDALSQKADLLASEKKLGEAIAAQQTRRNQLKDPEKIASSKRTLATLYAQEASSLKEPEKLYARFLEAKSSLGDAELAEKHKRLAAGALAALAEKDLAAAKSVPQLDSIKQRVEEAKRLDAKAPIVYLLGQWFEKRAEAAPTPEERNKFFQDALNEYRSAIALGEDRDKAIEKFQKLVLLLTDSPNGEARQREEHLDLLKKALTYGGPEEKALRERFDDMQKSTTKEQLLAQLEAEKDSPAKALETLKELHSRKFLDDADYKQRRVALLVRIAEEAKPSDGASFDKVLEDLKEALTLEPANATALTLREQTLTSKAKWQLKEKEFDAAIKTAKQVKDNKADELIQQSYRLWGQSLLASDLDLAKEKFVLAGDVAGQWEVDLRRFANNPEGDVARKVSELFDQAKSSLAGDELEAKRKLAVELLDKSATKLIDSTPKDAIAIWDALANKVGKRDEFDKNRANAFAKLASLNVSGGLWDDALKNFKQADTLEKDNTYYQDQRKEGANHFLSLLDEDLNKAIKQRAAQDSAMYQSLKRAVDLAHKAREIKTRDSAIEAKSYLREGQALYYSNEYDKSRQALLAAIKIEPRNKEALGFFVAAGHVRFNDPNNNGRKLSDFEPEYKLLTETKAIGEKGQIEFNQWFVNTCGESISFLGDFDADKDVAKKALEVVEQQKDMVKGTKNIYDTFNLSFFLEDKGDASPERKKLSTYWAKRFMTDCKADYDRLPEGIRNRVKEVAERTLESPTPPPATNSP